jgi:hypothetical protein
MEVKVLIYIIIGVVYAIGWFIKKMGNKSRDVAEEQTPYHTETSNPPNKPKQLTFEELLREITETKTVQQQPRPVVQPTYVNYDDDIEEEIQDLEVIPESYRKKDNIYDVYEEAKKAAFNRPSLEETMRVGDTDTKFARFKMFEQEEETSVLDEYAREFQDPAGFKKAFVMSEILKTKF